MTYYKKAIILIAVSIMIYSVIACTPAKSENEIAAEITLQAIYAEQTQSASIPVTGGDESSAEIEEVEEIDEVEAVPIEAPLLSPGEPPEPIRTLADSDSSIKASEHRVLSGDKYLENLYERPFTSQEMIYQPDLDIYSVDFAVDDIFFYYTINLQGMNNEDWGLNGIYGIEFDITLDGRGDMLVMTENPAAQWSIENVTVLVDQNRDVGGPKPIWADAGFTGSGYDQIVQIKGYEVAFARISPKDQSAIQISVSKEMLGNPSGFTWAAWADNGLRDVTMFDYNDTMGPSAAGSPFINDEDYPIDGLYNLDNTCRLAYGDTGDVSFIPGLCIIGVPTAEPGNGCTWRCTNPRYTSRDTCLKAQAQWVCR